MILTHYRYYSYSAVCVCVMEQLLEINKNSPTISYPRSMVCYFTQCFIVECTGMCVCCVCARVCSCARVHVDTHVTMLFNIIRLSDLTYS